MPYDLLPRYPIVGGTLEIGHDALAAEAARLAPGVLAIDGPAAFDWMSFVDAFGAALDRRHVKFRRIDVRTHMRPWPEVVRLTETEALRSDPVFATFPAGTLADLFASAPGSGPRDDGALTVAFGP